MSAEKDNKFLKGLLETNIDSVKFVEQIKLFSEYLVYSNSEFLYNETYLVNFCAEFVELQKFVKYKNNIFLGIVNDMDLIAEDLNLQFIMDQFWKYSLKNEQTNMIIPIQNEMICKDEISFKCILIYKDNEYLFLKTYSIIMENKESQDKIVKEVTKDLTEWIEGICDETRGKPKEN